MQWQMLSWHHHHHHHNHHHHHHHASSSSLCNYCIINIMSWQLQVGPAVQESKEFKHKIKELEKKIRLLSSWSWSLKYSKEFKHKIKELEKKIRCCQSSWFLSSSPSSPSSCPSIVLIRDTKNTIEWPREFEQSLLFHHHCHCHHDHDYYHYFDQGHDKHHHCHHDHDYHQWFW